MYRFALTMTPDDVEAVAAQLYVEMLEAGFARGRRVPLSAPRARRLALCARAEMATRIAAAATPSRHRPHAAAGVLRARDVRRRAAPARAAALPQRRRRPSPGLLEDSRAVMRDVPRGVVGVAPHSLRAVAPDELSAVVALAGDGPIHIHVAEQVKEVEDCLAWSGARPVRMAARSRAVDPRWCLIHATHMTADETRRAGADRRGRRPLPDHRGQSRRRHLQRPRVPRRGRALRRRRRIPTS